MPKTVLVLVPSLALLSQALGDILEHGSTDLNTDASAQNRQCRVNSTGWHKCQATACSVLGRYQSRSGAIVFWSVPIAARCAWCSLPTSPRPSWHGQCDEAWHFFPAYLNETQKTTNSHNSMFAFGLDDRHLPPSPQTTVLHRNTAPHRHSASGQRGRLPRRAAATTSTIPMVRVHHTQTFAHAVAQGINSLRLPRGRACGRSREITALPL